ncbi:RluA family pseudouridine synthase [Pullulanibacillus sp. KACC 23026]|uniref:RluA family pseudouridine synthase n=1 Tax=Pullulanibacillus sp. KACC 23026 TaxID=3028315 RepID=UPI0023B05E80|nr:RluA family pseudouridine synthase [Pullulanibacillus sp. KACC 23026]WEG11907.1 RluA family pseudouridine synthase [Pullulanibacillus sp. KACC 23026]
MKGPFKLSCLIPLEKAGQKLGDFVRTQMQVSRRAIKAIKYQGGEFLVDGTPQFVTYILKGGEQLEIVFPPEAISESLHPEPLPLDVIYEDDCSLVVNKSPGMPTIPSYQHFEGTLANGVVHYLREKGEAGASHPVTRLDRETSGLVLMAKHGHIHDLFSRLQKEKKIERRYIAVVHHPFAAVQGTINAPIGRKEGSIIERCVTDEGKEAITHYEVLWQNDDLAILGIRLETGRTHQIRVHFSSIGHPLIGDDLYGGELSLLKRQALHARHLFFPHPLSGKEIACMAPFPEDLLPLLEKGMERIVNWDARLRKR